MGIDCCPICDYCIDQWGKATHDNGTTWWYYDKKCICINGHISCAASDDNDSPFLPKHCNDLHNVPRLHGSEWINPDDKCQMCDCRNGKVACSKRCGQKQCKNGQILGKKRGECCPICLDNPNTCLAYGRGHILLIDGNVTNVENCIFTLMSNCKPVGPTGISGGQEYDAPKTGGKNGISLSSDFK